MILTFILEKSVSVADIFTTYLGKIYQADQQAARQYFQFYLLFVPSNLKSSEYLLVHSKFIRSYSVPAIDSVYCEINIRLLNLKKK